MLDRDYSSEGGGDHKDDQIKGWVGTTGITGKKKTMKIK